MLDTLNKLQRILNALVKLLPVIIEVLKDIADDGKLNKSA